MIYQLSEELMNEIMQTLARYPYREVAVIIAKISKALEGQNGKKIIEKPEEKKDV